MPQSRLYFGNASVVADDKTRVETRTLTAPEIAAGQLTLANAPVSGQITGAIANGGTFLQNVDFTLTGALVDWTASSYFSTFLTGQVIVFTYKIP